MAHLKSVCADIHDMVSGELKKATRRGMPPLMLKDMIRRCLLTISLLGAGTGCVTPIPPDKQGRVYHCVGTSRPNALPNTEAKKIPLEIIEYGDYRRVDGPTVTVNWYCDWLRVPQSAYLRYRIDDRVIEKQLNLSSLNPRRVRNKSLEFYVDGDIVEVRLLTPVPGTYVDSREVIVRQ